MTQFNIERALKKGPLDTDGYVIFRYHSETPLIGYFLTYSLQLYEKAASECTENDCWLRDQDLLKALRLRCGYEIAGLVGFTNFSIET